MYKAKNDCLHFILYQYAYFSLERRFVQMYIIVDSFLVQTPKKTLNDILHNMYFCEILICEFLIIKKTICSVCLAR